MQPETDRLTQARLHVDKCPTLPSNHLRLNAKKSRPDIGAASTLLNQRLRAALSSPGRTALSSYSLIPNGSKFSGPAQRLTRRTRPRLRRKLEDNTAAEARTLRCIAAALSDAEDVSG